MNNKQNDKEFSFNKFLDDDFFNEFGLTTEVLLTLKNKLMYFLSELINDKSMYAEEEKRILGMQDKIVKETGNLLVQNIFGMRSYLLTITGFSLAVIGAIFSIIVPNNRVDFTYPYLIYTGLVFLALCVIFSLIYLLIKLSGENRNLAHYLEYQRSATRSLHDEMINFFEKGMPYTEYQITRDPMQKEFRKKELEYIDKARERSKKRDWIPHFVVVFFIFGLLFLSMGFFY